MHNRDDSSPGDLLAMFDADPILRSLRSRLKRRAAELENPDEDRDLCDARQILAVWLAVSMLRLFKFPTEEIRLAERDATRAKTARLDRSDAHGAERLSRILEREREEALSARDSELPISGPCAKRILGLIESSRGRDSPAHLP